MIVLFVGGPNNGQRRDWAEPLRGWVRVQVWDMNGYPLPGKVREEEYVLAFMSVGGFGAPIYRHSKTTASEAVEMLLNGYHPAEGSQ